MGLASRAAWDQHSLTRSIHCNADAVLAERGEVAVSHAELNDLRSLAAHGADSAELAEETANLISLLHQARSSNAQVSKGIQSLHPSLLT